MSPEQIRRREVDQRADIWAFGCVLFEMLTGTRAFPGDSIPDVLARVMEREPAFGLLPSATPPAIRRLLRRTLDKNPARRLSHIADALLEFEDAAAEPEIELESPAPRRPWWPMALAVVAVGAGAGFATMLVTRSGSADGAEPPATRLVMALPPGDTPMISFQPMIAVSPDGRTVVYRARRGGTPMLFRRQLDRLESEPIPGTDGATGPFFSPDGRWLGFDGGGVIKRVSLDGGSPAVVADAPGGVTAAWAADDRIVFATNTGRVLQRVTSSGGAPETISTLDPQRGDTRHTLPQVLPGGDAVLFTVVTGTNRYVAILDTTTRQIATILEGTHPRLLAGGYLLVRQGERAVGSEVRRGGEKAHRHAGAARGGCPRYGQHRASLRRRGRRHARLLADNGDHAGVPEARVVRLPRRGESGAHRTGSLRSSGPRTRRCARRSCCRRQKQFGHLDR